jgi:hypothetical protein
MMASKGQSRFDEDAAYDSFPSGRELGAGREHGFNVKRRVNDASLFTEEALADPVIREFVDLPFDVSFLQTKSSSREAEWLIHKPHLVLAGERGDIDVTDGRFKHPGHITTLMVNHERTMARWKQSIILTQDGNDTASIVYKQDDGS